jgi:predicted outer membrane repeat protein
MWRRISFALMVTLAGLWPLPAHALGLATLAPAPAGPASGVVGTGSAASCTQAALNTALAGGGTITFDCGGPTSIIVADSQVISQPTTLFGGDVITLTGGGTNRLFEVQLGASLTLQHIVLNHGRANGGNGGSIYSQGSLYLDHTRIQDSQGHFNDFGGAIAAFGPLHITDSTLANNEAGAGGAIYANNFYNTARVFITRTTFSSNHAVNTSFGQGGAILLGAGAQLQYQDGALFGNSAQSGGAIYLLAGSVVTLTGQAGLVFSGNSALWDGGAIYNNNGRLWLSHVELNANTTPMDSLALGYGGAIFSFGTLFITDSYLSHNEGRFGGAVCACAADPTAAATIQNTTFALNTASVFGGGFYSNTGVVVQILDSSFNGNTSGAGGGLARINSVLSVRRSSFTYNNAQSGGGLFLATAPITDHTLGGYVDVRDVTFSGNTASGTLGGGVYNAGLAQLYSVTLKDNDSGVYSESGAESRLRSGVLQNTGANCQGTPPVDDGANYATDLSCAFPNSTQGAGLDPKLGPLLSDGLLRTYFHLPAADSPLVNHGPASASQCAEFDQRGRLRVDRCDIGAVEFHPLVPLAWLPLVQR